MDKIEPFVLSVLEPGEQVRAATRSLNGVMAVTTKRVVVADPQRVALDVPFEGIRRVQFDIERKRPATLVIVPERPRDEPQVLAIRPQDYEDAAAALVALGHAFYPPDEADEG